jgi:hypothetical protein
VRAVDGPSSQVPIRFPHNALLANQWVQLIAAARKPWRPGLSIED